MSLVVSFSRLVDGWRENDFQKAAGATRELVRLGVQVQIPSKSGAKGLTHAR